MIFWLFFYFLWHLGLYLSKFYFVMLVTLLIHINIKILLYTQVVLGLLLLFLLFRSSEYWLLITFKVTSTSLVLFTFNDLFIVRNKVELFNGWKSLTTSILRWLIRWLITLAHNNFIISLTWRLLMLLFLFILSFFEKNTYILFIDFFLFVLIFLNLFFFFFNFLILVNIYN